jgi:flavorubredoxin
MTGQKFKNKIGAAFGSYGWSGECVKTIEKHFQAAGIPLAREGLRCKWQPGEDEIIQCRAFGKEIAAAAKQI